MITTFELYERVSSTEIKIGDYVINRVSDIDMLLKSKNYINNHIGQVIAINDDYYRYAIKYDDPPIDPLDSDFYVYEKNGETIKYRWFEKFEILYWSDSKEELEIKLDIKKYNL